MQEPVWIHPKNELVGGLGAPLCSHYLGVPTLFRLPEHRFGLTTRRAGVILQKPFPTREKDLRLVWEGPASKPARIGAQSVSFQGAIVCAGFHGSARRSEELIFVRHLAALRRRSNVGLNKGEARNSLTRALFFHRHGEIRDRTFENQRYRASGLDLTIAAIVLWNTIYLSHAVAELRAPNPKLCPDKVLAHFAPLAWEHICFNGDYVWPSSSDFGRYEIPRSAFFDAA